MATKNSILLVILTLTLLSSGMTSKLVEETSLTVVQEGYVRAVGGELTYFTMNLSVPFSTDYQTSATNKPVIKADAVNPIVNIESRNPRNPFQYEITSSVLLKARHTTYIPQNYQLDYNQMLYTQPTARIQSNDADIRGLALSITANSSDDFERVSKLALWVNEHLTYDESLSGMLKDAKWVLDNKRGVCTEYATLFVAFARSIGIPARFVNGMAYDDTKDEWVGHSWAEAYLGTWVPVDPTWNEIGYLDATHLEFSKIFDNETFDNVFAYTSENARLDWSQSTPRNAAEVTLVSFKEGERRADYDLEGTASTIGFGMKTVVFVMVSSDDYRVVRLTLTPCGGDVLNVENGEKDVILEPNEPRVVSWVLTPALGLAKDYEYTCPLIINSDYFSPKELEVKVTPNAYTLNFNGFAEKDELQLGENQTVYVDVGVARTYSGAIYLTSDDFVYSQPITRSGRYLFSFRPKRVGSDSAYLATSFGGATKLNFQVIESGGVGVAVSAPQTFLLGSENKVYVNLTSNETYKNIRITASAGAYKEARQIGLAGNQTVEFSFNLNDSQVRNITISVEAEGFTRELVEPIVVYTIPTISFTKKLSDTGNGSVRADLIFSGVEDATDIVLSVDGNQISLKNGMASLLLTPGMHAVRLEYSDMGGTRRFYTAGLEIPATQYVGISESFVEAYISPAGATIPVVLYFGSIFILAVAVLILRRNRE